MTTCRKYGFVSTFIMTRSVTVPAKGNNGPRSHKFANRTFLQSHNISVKLASELITFKKQVLYSSIHSPRLKTGILQKLKHSPTADKTTFTYITALTSSYKTYRVAVLREPAFIHWLRLKGHEFVTSHLIFWDIVHKSMRSNKIMFWCRNDCGAFISLVWIT